MAQESVAPKMDFAHFLESVGPNMRIQLERPAKHLYVTTYSLSLPELKLYCTDERCLGSRVYGAEPTQLEIATTGLEFARYTCRNCQRGFKIFALLIHQPNAMTTAVTKLGEFPAFGPQTEPRTLRLIQPDRDLFLKARRAEIEGLGIGAFTYYRRVVERQRDRIFDRIISVAEQLKVPPDRIEELRKAKGNFRFEQTIRDFKELIPESLLINGHNPLMLLHSALSQGLHNDSDEDCLELAQDIRVVLAELADRAARAINDQKELARALGRLGTSSNSISKDESQPTRP